VFIVFKIQIKNKGINIIINAVRRRLWRALFSSDIKGLDSFFLDPRDHIGVERIVSGDFYEKVNLDILYELKNRLDLGSGICIDVGSNIGNHACFFSHIFSRVICVEPGDIAS